MQFIIKILLVGDISRASLFTAATSRTQSSPRFEDHLSSWTNSTGWTSRSYFTVIPPATGQGWPVLNNPRIKQRLSLTWNVVICLRGRSAVFLYSWWVRSRSTREQGHCAQEWEVRVRRWRVVLLKTGLFKFFKDLCIYLCVIVLPECTHMHYSMSAAWRCP